ncbi:MAG: cell division protein FtsI [Desulfobacterales bacterium CG23_combo_of_CG06-09_8_20_14_all_51_8]|nr:MAG: cell division protein FtsI [Desulfobacterales bacterium CG23_combo_of_CG06-09_8_20_14_all_51_8]
MNSTKLEQHRLLVRNRRILVIGGFLSLLYLVVGIKAFYLQVIDNDKLSMEAQAQYRQSMKCQGKRGSIFDVNYRELAIDTEVMEIGVHPQNLKTRDEKPVADKRALAADIGKILNLAPGDVYKKLTAKEKFVWLDRKVTPSKAAAFRELGLLGFEYSPAYLRVYPYKTMAAQLLGFAGVDGNGLDGLEEYFDSELQGNPRQWTIIRDRMGGIFERQEACGSDYEGNNLILTIDSKIQYIAETALQKSVEENNAKGGLAIVMSPKTGAVKAIANYPGFNPNAYHFFPKDTWRNRSITDTFEPGSVMKVFVVAAALESGICTPEMVFNCEGGAYRVGRSVIHDTHDYNLLTVHDVLKLSSNIGAVKIAEKIGPQIHYDMLTAFGFGEKTGIDCPGEVRGLLRHYQGWRKIDHATVAFGQGLAVTPIQLITAICAVANNGMLMTPYVVAAITDENGNIIKSFTPREKRKVIMPETAMMLMKMLSAATGPGGTGTKAVPVGYTVCGKTGTAQKINAQGNYHNCEYNGVFVGFSPAEDPELAVLVVIDEPQKYHYGGLVAAPVFREIVHETFNYLNIPPTLPPEQLNVCKGSGKAGA